MFTFHLNDYCTTKLPLALWLEKEYAYGNSDEHLHDCYEMLVMCEGSGCCVINGQRLPMVRGDMFLMTPNDRHIIQEDGKITFFNIMFAPSIFSDEEYTFFAPLLAVGGKYSFSPIHTNEILELLQSISSEFSGNRQDRLVYIRANFVVFMLLFFRNCHYQNNTIQDNKQSADRDSILLKRLSLSFREHITLKSLAQEIGMSTEFVRRRLKILTGGTLTKAVRNYRLEEARIRLENTQMNIAEIAFSLGYYDLSHFSRQFFQVFKCSPSEYRKKYKNSSQRPSIEEIAQIRRTIK